MTDVLMTVYLYIQMKAADVVRLLAARITGGSTIYQGGSSWRAYWVVQIK